MKSSESGWGRSALESLIVCWVRMQHYRDVFGPRWISETEVADPAAVPVAPVAPVAEPPPTDAPSALDDAEDQAKERPSTGGAEPPEEGPCRECKRLRRLNRLRLCYPCFVELVLMDEAKRRGHEWKPGDKHPDFCSCEGLGEHPERDRGAWRGN